MSDGEFQVLLENFFQHGATWVLWRAYLCIRRQTAKKQTQGNQPSIEHSNVFSAIWALALRQSCSEVKRGAGQRQICYLASLASGAWRVNVCLSDFHGPEGATRSSSWGSSWEESCSLVTQAWRHLCVAAKIVAFQDFAFGLAKICDPRRCGLRNSCARALHLADVCGWLLSEHASLVYVLAA